MAGTDYRLEANSKELRGQLARANKLLKSAADAPVLLCYDGTKLTFAAPGVAVQVSAQGQWPRPIRVAANLLPLLADGPAEDDGTVVLSFDGERLHVGDWGTFGAQPASEGQHAVDLMPPSNLCEALYLGLRHRSEELRASALQDTVRRAQGECDRLLDRAAKILAPLGIEKADLRALHEMVLQRLMGQLDRGKLTP